MLPTPGLYVHLPWCIRKCPYCDFNSHEAAGPIPEAAYLQALIRDFEGQTRDRRVAPFASVFLGGGTPSLFSPATIGQLLDYLSGRGYLAADAEITLEANPGAIDYDRFRGFRAAGVNRLSVGIQSFSPTSLQALGRIHDDAEARHAADLAVATFPRVNLDLMYGTPGQRPEQAVNDVRTALATGAGHISAYQLTLEANTRFFRDPPVLPDEDQLAELEQLVHGALGDHGLSRYEVSAWALPQQQSVHNLNYWTFGDYLGIGAGAHGKITHRGAGQQTWRSTHTRVPDDYLRDPLARTDPVAATELPFEFMLNALRLANGSTRERFEITTGQSLDGVAPIIDQLERQGWMVPRPRIATTALGWRFLNTVLEAFLPDRQEERR